jgi:hypothetical protein
MPQVIWTRYFLEAQGYGVCESKIYQDSQIPPNLPPPIDLFPPADSSSSTPIFRHSVSQDNTTTVHIIDDPSQSMDCTPTHSFLEDSDILPVVHAARLNHVSYTN